MSKARELAELSRTVSDSADAVAITIDSSENVTFANDITVTGTVTADGSTVGSTSDSQSVIQMLANSTNGANTIHFGDGASADAYRGYINYAHDSDSLQFAAAGSEAFRLTAAQDMYFGQTSGSAADVGIILQKAGNIFSTVNGGTSAYFRRNTSDGEIIRLSKDGTTVGSIDTHSGAIQFGQGNVNMAFENATDQVYPVNDSGTNNDGDIDLGKSNARFKDIHLSGGVNFSANANASGMTSETLSDYEEGTCSLTWSGSGGTANFTNTAFNYVKVGNLVSINGRTLSSSPNITGTLELTGLPFAAVGDASGSILYRNLTPPSGAHTLICFLGNGSARFQPFWAAAGTYVQLNSSHINSNSAQDMYLSINYRTS